MFLGLDLGTSSLKASLINADHKTLATAEVALWVNRPYTNWSEQDPREWIDALHKVFADLSAQADLSAVERIGLSGQMHGATLLDSNGAILRPCILWNDGRSQKQCEELMAHGDAFITRAGNIAMPGFTAPKLLWVKEHEPEIFKQIATVLLPKDYLRYYLTGARISDPSDSCGTLWMNPETRAWDSTLLAMGGMAIEQMPDIKEGPDITGVVKSDVANQLGIGEIEVVAGGGDNACGALGLGVSQPGESFISLGTSGVFFCVSEQHLACPEKTVHAFAHAIPNTWHQMTVTLSAASSLSWLAGILKADIRDLLSRLKSSHRLRTDVIFLPYLNGERSPHNNPEARGVFFNLSSSTDDLDLCLAVLEGVAFSFCDGRDALIDAGASFDQPYVIGGGSRSPLWLQILANSVGLPMVQIEGGESGASLGAARLAMTEQGLAYPRPTVLQTISPNVQEANYFADKLGGYRDLYQNLASQFVSTKFNTKRK